MFVHLAFLNSFASRFGVVFRWARSMLGRARSERVISVARRGGDLSAPDADAFQPIVLDDPDLTPAPNDEQLGRVRNE
jgi:hypothetical protein